MHGLDYAALGLGELGKPQGYLERQVRGWMERYQGSKTHDLPEVEPLSRWLREHMPSHSGATLVHNDYKYDNMVLDPSDITRVKAVLDWEMCTLGDPLTDLGTALAYWIDPDDPPEMQTVRWGPTIVPGMLRRAELAATLRRENRPRSLRHRLLLCVRHVQGGGDHPADLLPLFPWNDQG